MQNVILTSAMSSVENLSEFVLEPGPEDCLVRCRVTRNNKGIDKGRVSSKAKLRLNMKT